MAECPQGFGTFYGDYWVLDHADDYSWSIVGESSGRYLRMLARTPTPPDAKVADLIDRTQAVGYDTSMLIRTGPALNAAAVRSALHDRSSPLWVQSGR